MNFILKLSLRLFSWSLIFGFITGIFGISLSLMNIVDFYIQEGTQQVSDVYSYRINHSDNKPIGDLLELQNIEGIAFVDPYFTVNQILGSINYFGFSASENVTVQGIPKRLGIKKSDPAYTSQWESVDLSSIPVLLPQQAIMLYNNLAPQNSWPILSGESFLGLPGVNLNIGSDTINAVISGLDSDEFNLVLSVPSEKLYAIYNHLNLNPAYDYVILETVPGLSSSQRRETIKKVEALGYQTSDASETSFQRSLFTRIKYTIGILGFGILIAFVLLLHYNIFNLISPLKQKVLLYRIWSVRDYTFLQTIFISLAFSLLTGGIAWLLCFFAVVPAQEYIIETISRFGLPTPSLRDSVRVSLETAFFSTSLYFSINIFTLLYFYYKTKKVKS